MKLSLNLLIVLILVLAASTAADVPTALNYQAILNDSSGVAVADSVYEITFTIYDAAAGGNSKWTETRMVSVTSGLFNILLGSINQIEDTVFKESTRYLAIQVGVDPEISPRTKLMTVPYSFRTSTVDGASGGVIDGDVSVGTEPFSIGGGSFSNLYMGGTIGYAQNIGNLFSHPMFVMFPSDTAVNQDRMIYQLTPTSQVGLLYKFGSNRFDFTVGSGLPALSVDLTNFRVGINNISPTVALDVNGTLKAGGGIFGSGSTISGIGSFIAAKNTTITGNWASCTGGQFNNISSDYAWIPGGRNCEASGIYSFAAGVRAMALHDGAFVWADSTTDLFTTDFVSTAVNQFSVRCRGGARFVTAIDTNSDPSSGVELAAGGGSWSSMSDRNAKENFAPVNNEELLERLVAIPIGTWKYKTQDASVRHIGPMAQDFYSAFAVGEDERHITSIDADGVALAAIQALYKQNRDLKEQLTKQKNDIDELKKLLLNLIK